MTAENIRDAALNYAAKGWRIFPCAWTGPHRKKPLTEHGFKNATADLYLIRSWWRRWPSALIGVPTGRENGFVVLDVDVKPDCDGCITLAALGFPELPVTPRARTASGGFHIYFKPPADREVPSTTGARGRGIGPGLDWRGEGGYVIAPSPGSGYTWEIGFGVVPLVSVPTALLPREICTEMQVGRPAATTIVTPYAEAALVSAAEKILAAPNGEQEATLNGECFSIGRLAGAGDVPADLALDILLTAAHGMVSYLRSVNGEARRPWGYEEIEKKVRRAFEQGAAKPRAEWVDVERDELALDRAMRGADDAE